MLEFMDYVQAAFFSASRWNVDNSYATLNNTVHSLLDFHTPRGIALHVSSLSSPNFATSYTVGSQGLVDGSLSFLYSSLNLNLESKSIQIPLRNLIPGYKRLRELTRPEDLHWNELWQDGKRVDRKDALLYGRMYLPSSTLEALYLRRISPTRLLKINCVSGSALPNGGTALALLQNDYGKYSTEYLYSTDSALLGVRGLYNFGFDPRTSYNEPTDHPTHLWEHQNGRLSAGAEAYFSPRNKSAGVSAGLRFATLPVHTGFPYTMTCTMNPLMGNLSATYAVKAGPNLALCSRFDFNWYSYESDVVVGMELSRRKLAPEDVVWARKLLRPEWGDAMKDELESVIKARTDQNGKVGLLWEGKINELLVGVGANLDMKSKDRMLGNVGLQISYST
ncbi:hypothetical protein MBLNU230_g0045t1 [Neophaeotheca triangularis]